jgi:hypothetical protein
VLVVTACLLAASCSTEPEPSRHPTDAAATTGAAPPNTPSTSPLDGLWSGSWGGGESDGVVMQPVLSELLIDGDHVEITGFPDTGDLLGTLQVEADAQRMQVISAVGADGSPPPRTLDYTYELNGDALTLIANDGRSIVLQRRDAVRNALANVPVEFVAASGINGAGDLLVTEFSVLRAGREDAAWYEPRERAFNTRRATVLLVQESATKEISIDEARSLVHGSTPVVIAFREDHSQQRRPQPDSPAVRQVYSHVLRPGTVVFILSADDNVPQP